MPKKAKPAEVNGGHPTITVSNWKTLHRGNLRGFLSLTLPSGLTIHNCQLLESNGRPWIGLPARRFQLADKSIAYQPIVEFTSRAALQKFRAEALRAVDRYFERIGRVEAACSIDS